MRTRTQDIADPRADVVLARPLGLPVPAVRTDCATSLERFALAVFFLLLSGGVVFTACPSAPESPFRPDGGAVGDVGQPCLSGQRCNLPTLACVVGDPATPVDTCRVTCNPTASDPCGAAFVCVPFCGDTH